MNLIDREADQGSLISRGGRAIFNAVIACTPAAIGGSLFAFLALPAAWLTGGILFSAGAALIFRPPIIAGRIKDAAIIVLGIAIGSSVTKQMLLQAGDWPASIIVLLSAVYLMLFTSYAVLRVFFGWTPATAFWSSAPGALTASLAMAEDARADVRYVAGIHMTRVLAVSLFLPFAFTPTPGLNDIVRPEFGIWDFLLLLLAGYTVAFIFKRLAVPGGMLLGAFGASALLSATGIVAFSMPPALTAIACVIFASFIGGQFSGLPWRIFYGIALASVVSFLAAFFVSIIAAWVGATILGLPFSQLLISYAPGGLDVLILVAFLMKADPAFVSTHHFVRLLVLVLTLPAIERFVIRPRPKALLYEAQDNAGEGSNRDGNLPDSLGHNVSGRRSP